MTINECYEKVEMAKMESILGISQSFDNFASADTFSPNIFRIVVGPTRSERLKKRGSLQIQQQNQNHKRKPIHSRSDEIRFNKNQVEIYLSSYKYFQEAIAPNRYVNSAHPIHSTDKS